MNTIIINDKLLKPYDHNYYVSEDGDVYSLYSQKFLKHSIDCDGYHRVDIHSKHMKIHRLVYATWYPGYTSNMQINHIDDNKDNNNINNLYHGTQKQNIQDCINNNHRVGNIGHLTVFDKDKQQILTFCPMKDFIKYCGHSCKNGSVKKFFNKKWFKSRYTILDYRKGKCND